ncbi:hypothetical protein HJ588_12705 [Flexivirga sp. ID2601S]|uniref:DUF7847 domain-containing protein n=1 Tax=Flexivirga aerilata TaxID=1656889 RepID=A0A849AH04_9MICO|nr:hypothetical protein [Flexivirga aerilata]NNG40124.1 hypothetical protein [Flexivirga aerilata]
MSNGWTSPGGDSPSGEQPPPPSPQYGQHGQQAPPQYGQYGQYGQQAPPQYGQYGPPQPPTQPPYPQYGAPPGYGAPAPGYAQLAPKPGVIPLRPLRLGDVFEGTFATIRGNPGATLGLSAIVALVVAIPAILTTIAFSNADLSTTDDSGTTLNFGTQIGQNVSGIYMGLAGIFLTGMLTIVVAEAVLGRRISIGETWQKVRGRLLPLLGMTMLQILALVVFLVIGTAIVVVLALTAPLAVTVSVGIVLGLALVVGFVYVWVKIGFAGAALVLERIGPIAAFKRSWALTKGQWWRIFGITLLGQLLVSFVAGIATMPAALILGISAADSGTPSVGAIVAFELITVAISALTAPFVAGVSALLYLDQRIRKEALDVTLMQAAGQDKAGAA